MTKAFSDAIRHEPITMIWIVTLYWYNLHKAVLWLLFKQRQQE